MPFVPLTRSQAHEFILRVHRHHKPPQGYKFAIGLTDDAGAIRGVVTVGRPVARHFDDGKTAEVTRLATDGRSNGCSALYGAAARTAKEMGYERIITYILASEPGTSLKASGWKCLGPAGGGSWSVPSRPRVDKAPTEPKTLWERRLHG